MLLKQGHVAPRWNYSLQGLCGRSHELADRCEISISQIEMDLITDKTFIELLLETGTAYLRENYCLTQILF